MSDLAPRPPSHAQFFEFRGSPEEPTEGTCRAQGLILNHTDASSAAFRSFSVNSCLKKHNNFMRETRRDTASYSMCLFAVSSST